MTAAQAWKQLQATDVLSLLGPALRRAPANVIGTFLSKKVKESFQGLSDLKNIYAAQNKPCLCWYTECIHFIDGSSFRQIKITRFQQSAGVMGKAQMREWEKDGQGQKKDMKIRNKKEKQKPLSRAQEMSWLRSNISTSKELGQIRMAEEITKPTKENKEVSDIWGIKKHEE